MISSGILRFAPRNSEGKATSSRDFDELAVRRETKWAGSKVLSLSTGGTTAGIGARAGSCDR